MPRITASIVLALCAMISVTAFARVLPAPAVIVFIADDATTNDYRLRNAHGQPIMPNLHRLAQEGVYATNFHVGAPACAPSRLTMMTGQRAINIGKTGMLGNTSPYGGFDVALAGGAFDETIFTHLKRWVPGIKTAYFGKVMNGHDVTWAMADPVLPGVDVFWGASSSFNAYGYLLNHDGIPVSFGYDEQDYFGDVIARLAADEIRSTPRSQPLIVFVSLRGPHSPAQAPHRYRGACDEMKIALPASHDQPVTGATPMAQLPPLEHWQKEQILKFQRDRICSLRAVDDALGIVVKAFEEAGRSDTGHIVFMSDNGLNNLGAHRLFIGKGTAYAGDTNVPLVVRGGRIPHGIATDALIGNHDLASTLAAMLGAPPLQNADGRSVLSWLTGGEQYTREALAIDDPIGVDEQVPNGNFRGLVTRRYSAIDYGPEHGFELYRAEDGLQLHNIAPSMPPAFIAALRTHIDMLAGCSGQACRDLEDLKPPELPQLLAVD